MMTVLVCGDRHWSDIALIRHALSTLPDDTIIIQGGARGADEMAAIIAVEFGFELRTFAARWELYGRAAGPIRNQRMLDEGKPHLVMAFHHDLSKSKGTADMVRRAKKAGIEVIVYSQEVK